MGPKSMFESFYKGCNKNNPVEDMDAVWKEALAFRDKLVNEEKVPFEEIDMHPVTVDISNFVVFGFRVTVTWRTAC